MVSSLSVVPGRDKQVGTESQYEKGEDEEIEEVAVGGARHGLGCWAVGPLVNRGLWRWWPESYSALPFPVNGHLLHGGEGLDGAGEETGDDGIVGALDTGGIAEVLDHL